MIAGLRGILANVEESAVVVDLHGFLVRAFAPGSTLGQLDPIGSLISLHTYLAVREDALTLYGFATKAELQFFELLIAVNGVGPRAALGLLTFADPATIYQAIADEDTTLLSRAPGIGKVTAGRIILDLKRKLPDDFTPTLGGEVDNRDQETIAALESLGYTSSEARNALAAVDNRSGLTIEERIIAALRNMDEAS